MKIINKIAPLLVLFVFSFVFVSESYAAQFQKTSIRYDRMKTSTPTSAQFLMIPATVNTENKIKVVFGAGVTVAATPTVTVTGLPSGAIAVPGSLVAAGAGTSMVITGVSDMAVGTTYAFNVSVGISTPVASGQILDSMETQTAANATIDKTTVASRFITDDQIVITGNVPPAFNFVLSGNTDAFTGDLTASSVISTTGNTVSVSTNASKGWIGWVKSANTGLNSVTTGESIATSGTIDAAPTTCGVGVDCYVLDADLTTSGAGSGSLTIDGEYNGGTTSAGGTLSTSLQPFATRNGKTTGDVVTLIARASIIATKAAAADYTDTLTVIGAGNF